MFSSYADGVGVELAFMWCTYMWYEFRLCIGYKISFINDKDTLKIRTHPNQ